MFNDPGRKVNYNSIIMGITSMEDTTKIMVVSIHYTVVFIMRAKFLSA